MASVLIDLPPTVLAWCALALFCGGLIKGALGVGTPLLTVPMMALVLPPQTAIALMAIPVVIANLWQFAGAERSLAVAARFWPTFVAIFAGLWVGVSILAEIDDRHLLIVVGVAVIAFALLQVSRFRLHLPERRVRAAGILFGGASGLIGGLSSFFGPMLIVYLIAIRDLGKQAFVGIISFLYVSAVLPWAVMLYLYGILDNRLLLASALATLPVAAGMVAGQRLRAHIDEGAFRLLIIGILVVSGLSMLWRAAQ